MQTLSSFKESLSLNEPPKVLSIYLTALWYDGKGQWDKAHGLIDDLEDKTACWVHAYLHRKEGDRWNANYWYTKAGRIMPETSLNEEWETVVTALLQQ